VGLRPEQVILQTCGRVDNVGGLLVVPAYQKGSAHMVQEGYLSKVGWHMGASVVCVCVGGVGWRGLPFMAHKGCYCTGDYAPTCTQKAAAALTWAEGHCLTCCFPAPAAAAGSQVRALRVQTPADLRTVRTKLGDWAQGELR
jgi:hypothetical protein